MHGKNHKEKKKYALLVDLIKAFPSINRDVLFDILWKRTRNEKEKHLIKLIGVLYRTTWNMIGDASVETKMGVPEGGILSPLLFNVYLEEALLGQRELKEALN